MKIKNEEVKLAKSGTIMARFQKERTDAISDMFDNVDKVGIYLTSKFFVRLDNALEQALDKQKKKIIKKIDRMTDNWGGSFLDGSEFDVLQDIEKLKKKL